MKTIILTLAAVALLSATAVPAVASGCTTEYQLCLNDSYNLNAIIRAVADFACFDDYITCVSRRLLFG